MFQGGEARAEVRVPGRPNGGQNPRSTIFGKLISSCLTGFWEPPRIKRIETYPEFYRSITARAMDDDPPRGS